MANTYKLGGSPLGLINVLSRPTRDNMSTFNAGKSRNVNVISYNRSRPQDTGQVQKGKLIQAPRSLFTGGTIPRFFANPDPINQGEESDELGISEAEKFSDPSSDKFRTLPSKIHNDRMYDMSILNIIENLSKSKSASLRPGDFAYLKHLGVYPNNRLMICRRFSGPVGDNIFKSVTQPKAVLIGWKPEDEDFLSFSFGEEWIEADADFTAVLNKMGQDFGLNNLGDSAGKAFNIIPLPGFTETLQRTVLETLGILEKGSKGTPLPAGNPNIIKQAKRRKTIAGGEAGSGLKCSISVKVTVEYEQKFISGIDPTIAFMDIINNIIIFGTSRSDSYGLSSKFSKNLNKWLSNPSSLINDLAAALGSAIQTIKKELQDAAKKALDLLNEAVQEDPKKDADGNVIEPEPPSAADQKKSNDKLINKAKKAIERLFDEINGWFTKHLSKYKVEILGIANALSGAPSAPWHLTLGNPMRPFFCCGDMLAGDVTITFGPHLAFNDLPSSIKAEFTLTNARPLGLQEIVGKFNTGNVRVVNIKKDYIESNDSGSDSGQYFDAIFDTSGTQLNKVENKQQENKGLSGGSPSTTSDATNQVNAATEQLKKEKEELDKIKTEKGETSQEYIAAKSAYDKKVSDLATQAQNNQKQGGSVIDNQVTTYNSDNVMRNMGPEVNIGQNSTVLSSFTNQSQFTPPG